MKQSLSRRNKPVVTNPQHRGKLKPVQITKRQESTTLNSVLNYRNAAVVNRYLKDFGGTEKEANVVFRETLKWLSLGKHSFSVNPKHPVQCFITSELTKIDDMWHTFILFTRDYTDFCTRYFGGYIHHQPVTDEGTRIPIKELRRFYERVYDTLGRVTFRRWFLSGRFRRKDN